MTGSYISVEWRVSVWLLPDVDVQFPVHVDRRDTQSGVVEGSALIEVEGLLGAGSVPDRMAASGHGRMVSALGHVFFGLRDPGRRTETNPENDRTAFSVPDNVRQKEGQRFAGECRVVCSIMGMKRGKRPGLY